MPKNTYTRELNNAVASIEMEGLVVSEEYKVLCNKVLKKEITFAQYIEFVKQSQGVDA